MADPAAGASGESSHLCCHIILYTPLISLMRAMAEDFRRCHLQRIQEVSLAPSPPL
jgi:hypothetical protein